ncbi:MAG: DNA repair protein RecO [Ignavibacteria bacterium]|nr:MAG: DNA repair protein RecO [Ignavibacteria bacterium]
MSSIEKTEAVVLRSMPYRETSKIVSFYTRRFGKLSTIVKGARRSPGRYGSSLEPMSYDSIVIYKKETRELQTLTQCDRLRPFLRLYEDLAKMSAGMGMIEITAMVAHDEEENGGLFSLLVGCLSAADAATKNPGHVLYCFEVQLAKILGFQPSFSRCVECGKTIGGKDAVGTELRFHLERGGPLCESCSVPSGHAVGVSGNLLQTLEALSQMSDPLDATQMDIDHPQGAHIQNFLWNYLRYHVQGLRPLNSEKVASQILALP